MARAAKPKKEVSMEETLWKSADKLRGVPPMSLLTIPDGTDMKFRLKVMQTTAGFCI